MLCYEEERVDSVSSGEGRTDLTDPKGCDMLSENETHRLF